MVLCRRSGKRLNLKANLYIRRGRWLGSAFCTTLSRHCRRCVSGSPSEKIMPGVGGRVEKLKGRKDRRLGALQQRRPFRRVLSHMDVLHDTTLGSSVACETVDCPTTVFRAFGSLPSERKRLNLKGVLLNVLHPECSRAHTHPQHQPEKRAAGAQGSSSPYAATTLLQHASKALKQVITSREISVGQNGAAVGLHHPQQDRALRGSEPDSAEERRPTCKPSTVDTCIVGRASITKLGQGGLVP